MLKFKDNPVLDDAGAFEPVTPNANPDTLAQQLRSVLSSPDADDKHHPLADAFRAFIGDADFPCVGAKAALARDQIDIVIAKSIDSNWDDVRIYARLQAFAQAYKSDPDLFRSFVVIFEGPLTLSEEKHEAMLWTRIQSLTHKDEWLGHSADARVSQDPEDPHFSLSFGEEAFFVVGLHPNASRPARRFHTPAMVFNLHDQFEQLRSAGSFDKMQQTILKRDVAIAGSVNPMLSRFGERSEARQYSGRAVDHDWRCPFSGRDLGKSDDN